MLVEFVKNKRGHRVGTVVAVSVSSTTIGVGDDWRVGWSGCNAKKGDHFDEEFGMMIAEGRALEGSGVPIPRHIRPIVTKMYDRAERYFK